MIALALLGLRYWTLVIGGLLSAALGTGALLVLRRHRFAWPRLGTLQHAMTFSGHVFLARLSWYTYSNADFLVAGRVLGKIPLGLYELGWTLASIPIDKVTALVTQVTPPIFSAVQHDYAALRRYVLTITEGLAFIVYPLCLGMALVAPDFVRFALGAKWQGAIVPLQLLALSACFRGVTPILSQVLLVIGQARVVMKYGVMIAVALPLSFYLLAKSWGTVGLALTWVLVFPLLAVPAYRRALATIQLPVREYLRALWPAFASGVIMVAALVALILTLGQRWSPGYRLGTEVAFGAAVYALTGLTLYRTRITRFYTFVRGLR
jgi:PST family polysaccharide transporter